MCAPLSLPHTTAHGNALFEGHPMVGSKTLLLKGRPQQQNVDAGVAAAGKGILGKPQGEKLFAAGPRLNPWHNALFKLGNDLVGNISIKIVFLNTLGHRNFSSSAPEPESGVGGDLRLKRPAG